MYDFATISFISERNGHVSNSKEKGSTLTICRRAVTAQQSKTITIILKSNLYILQKEVVLDCGQAHGIHRRSIAVHIPFRLF